MESKEGLAHVTTWTTLEARMLSERSHTQTATYFIILFI